MLACGSFLSVSPGLGDQLLSVVIFQPVRLVLDGVGFVGVWCWPGNRWGSIWILSWNTGFTCGILLTSSWCFVDLWAAPRLLGVEEVVLRGPWLGSFSSVLVMLGV